MKNFGEGQVIGIPVLGSSIKEGRSFGFSWINKLRKTSNINLSKKTHQTSKVERLFRKSFSVDKEERLVKGCRCYLSTTAGPIKGSLFISTKKVAFCSDELLKIPSNPKGKIVQVPYKVVIPVKKVKKTIPSANVEKPQEKYLQIVTVDNFEFWFMGENAFSKLQ